MEIRKEIPSLNDKDSDILILISDQHSILTNKQTLIAQLVKNPTCRRPWFDSWVGKISWRRERLPIPAFWPGELHGDHGVAKSQTLLTSFQFTQKIHNNVTQVFNPILSICWFMLCHKNLLQEGSFSMNRICSTSCILWLEQTQLNCILFSEITKTSMLRGYDRVVVV